MASRTPFAQHRRALAYYKAQNPHVIAMEKRAHTQAIEDYFMDVFQNLNALEPATQLQPDLIATQPEITVAMRPILFDFLLDVHSRLRLSESSFYLTISIIDRYCSLRIVRKDHFQLLGLTALWVASKFIDPKHKVPSLAFLRATCCNCYKQSLFLEMECHILKSLDWEVDAPTHDSFIDLIILEKLQSNQISEDSVEVLSHLASYICHFLQFHHKITFKYTISQVALASIIASTRAITFHNELMCQDISQGSTMDFLVDEVLNTLRDCQVPSAVKNKFQQSQSEYLVYMQMLNDYASDDSRRQPLCAPRTPYYSYRTSPVSRQGSHSDSDSVFSSRGSSSTFATPASSCSASPMEQMKNPIFQKQQQHAPAAAQPQYTYSVASSQAPQFGGSLSRKRSRSSS